MARFLFLPCLLRKRRGGKEAVTAWLGLQPVHLSSSSLFFLRQGLALYTSPGLNSPSSSLSSLSAGMARSVSPGSALQLLNYQHETSLHDLGSLLGLASHQAALKIISSTCCGVGPSPNHSRYITICWLSGNSSNLLRMWSSQICKE